MADKTTVVKIEYDTNEAQQNIDNLALKIDGLKETNKFFQREINNARKDLKKTDEQLKKEGKTRENLIKTINNGTVKLSRNKDAIQKTNAERRKSIKELTGEKSAFDKLTDSINESTKEQKKQTGMLSGMSAGFGNLEKSISALPGPIGGAVTGIKAMTKASLAFIATPIGMILAAIALAVMAVKKAFTSSEEGQNKYNKMMGVLNAILGNLGDLLADIGEKIIAFFENPQESLKNFGELLKKNFINRFKGLLELLPALTEAIGLLFKGEFKEAGKVATNAVMKVTTGIDNFTDRVNNAINKTKEFIKENEREAALAAKVADMRAKADKIERDLIIKRAELESKIAELRLKAREEDKYTAEERKQFLKEARDLQDGLLNDEKEVLELRRDAIQLENTFSKTNKENKMKEAEAVAAVSQKEAERFNQARQVQRELMRVDKEIEAEQKRQAEEKRKREEAELKRRGEAVAKMAELKHKELINEAANLDELRQLKIDKANEEFAAEMENDTLLNEERELLEMEHKQRLAEIDNEYFTNKNKQELEAKENAINTMTEVLREAGQFENKRVSLIADSFDKIAEINFKELQSSKEKYAAIGGVAQSLTGLITAGNAAQVSDLEKSKQAELKAVGDNAFAKSMIEKKYNKKLVQLKKKQFNEDKIKSLTDTAIATALAVAKALPNVALSAIVGGIGAIQGAIIASKRPPKFSSDQVFARGGMIGGRPHSQGGTKFYGEDGSRFEAERGEALFVLKKDAAAEIAALSMLNESHGGRSFRDKPVSRLQDGGTPDISPIDINQAVDNALNNKPIFVRVKDIETGLTNYNNVKNVGTI